MGFVRCHAFSILVFQARRFMDISIVLYLLEHEIGYVGSRDVRVGADEEWFADFIGASYGCIGEP